MSDVLDRKQFIAGYLVEVEEHLRASNAHLLAIEAGLAKGEPHHRRVRELFRSLHTVKGLSAMVGADPVVDLAHEMEAVLRLADQSTGQLSTPAVESLLKGVEAIESRVAAFGSGKPVAPAPHDLLDALSALQPGARHLRSSPADDGIGLEPALLAKLSSSERAQLAQSSGSSRRAVRVQYEPSAARTAEGITISTVRGRVGEIAEIVKVLPIALPKSAGGAGTIAFILILLSERSLEELAAAAFAAPDAVAVIPITGAAAASGSAPTDGASDLDDEGIPDAPLRSSSIRVDVERLDDAMEKLSELVVTRFRLARAVNALREQGVDVRELSSIVGENARQLRDLRACITRARMVPVRELLERVPLIVRGMNRTTGKQVRLQIEAGSAELDKSVAERVFPAIIHLVRNAVDHAIEPPAERRALGKHEQGLVTVSCFQHASNELELRVGDDGRGLDAAAIAARAGRAVPRNDQELLELITQPGFSTLDHATSSSGRGMGMDIVRSTVSKLGGSLTLRTTPREGSVFSLRIPLSISIVDALAFACGEQAFVVPVAMVDEIIEVDAASVVTPPAPSERLAKHAALKMVERRGRAMPLISLGGLFAMAAPPAAAQKALVVRQSDDAFAFAVDRMLGQQEVVVRPIEDPLVKVTGVAGSTDLGDGKPTLVLDLVGLIGLASRDSARAAS
jgi:two-component system chemotaxis sensor kinase CheA